MIKSKKVIYILGGVVLFIILLGSYLYRISPNNPKNIVSENKLEMVSELSVLEKYFSDKDINYPTEYSRKDTPYEKILKLRTIVIDREVTWISGGFIAVKPSDVVDENLKAQSESRIDEMINAYRDKAVEGESIFDLVNQANLDNELLSAGDGDARSLGFNKVTQDRRFFSDETIEAEMFAADKGTISPILRDKRNGTYAFFVITDRHGGNSKTYQEWLNQASGGTIIKPSSKYQ